MCYKCYCYCGYRTDDEEDFNNHKCTRREFNVNPINLLNNYI